MQRSKAPKEKTSSFIRPRHTVWRKREINKLTATFTLSYYRTDDIKIV